MYAGGDVDLGVVACGQGVGLAHDIPTVRELFDGIVSQAKEIVRGLAAS